MSFESLGLKAVLCRAVANKGYTTPTPIQHAAIPIVLQGRDLMAAAQTGTGKTAGFTLPLLQRLSQTDSRNSGVRALILTPTRELCLQVMESVSDYGKGSHLKTVAIFGGVGFTPQATALRKGVDIVVATPGRLLDHVAQRTIDLSRIEVLVLDEADRMLDMGFIRDIRKTIALLPAARQTLLFSATFSSGIRELAKGLLKNPASVEVAPRNATVGAIRQTMHPVDKARKRELLSWMIGNGDWQQVLVFARTKHGADRLARQLVEDGLSADAIHGNKSQGARTRALMDFKRGKTRVLVATDLASRGLDIDQLPHVVNYELPSVPEDYIHRIGRTGRAGHGGEAVSLVCIDEHKLLKDIERLLGKAIPSSVVPGYEVDRGIRAEPLFKPRNGAPASTGRHRPRGKPPSPGQRRGRPGSAAARRP